MARIVVGTNDGVWLVEDGDVEELGLAGRDVGHVASRGDNVLATVSHDGLYSVTGAGDLRIWDGDARACAIGPDGVLYVGSEPAMLHRSDDEGESWTRCNAIDDLPTRSTWYFPPPPHEPHVRSIDFLPGSPASVLVGVEVGGVLLSTDRGDTWAELNNGVHVDVHTVRPDPTTPGRLIAVTGGGVYGTDDGGESWSHRTDGLTQGYAVGLHFNPERAGEALVATGQGPPGVNGRVCHTLDGGLTWSELKGRGLPDAYPRVPVVLFTDGAAWLLTADGDVFRADVPQAEWTLSCHLPVAITSATASGSPSSIMGWR